jgi:hypothetical protein
MSHPHSRLAALVWRGRQYRDSDSRSSDESMRCRLNREDDGFNLRGLWSDR